MASLELQSLQETLSENSIETVADLKSLSRSNEDMQELGFSAEQLTRLVAWGSGKPVKRSVEAIEAKEAMEAMEAKRATAAAASAAAAAAAAVPTPTDEGFQNSEGDTDFQTRMRKDAPTGQVDYKAQLSILYKRVNPAMLPKVDHFLRKYKGNEAQMLNQIRAKYGLEPTEFGAESDDDFVARMEYEDMEREEAEKRSSGDEKKTKKSKKKKKKKKKAKAEL